MTNTGQWTGLPAPPVRGGVADHAQPHSTDTRRYHTLIIPPWKPICEMTFSCGVIWFGRGARATPGRSCLIVDLGKGYNDTVARYTT